MAAEKGSLANPKSNVPTAGIAKLSVGDSKSNEFKDKARSVPVSSLVRKDRKVIEISSEDNVVDAFKTILSNKILSAPVYDEKAKKYIGFLDTRDLTQYVTFMHDEKQKESSADDKLKPPAFELNSIFDAATRMFPQAEAGITVKYLARRNRFVSVTEQDNVLKAVELMCQADVHRVAVVNAAGRCIDILSQSSIVQFIHENRASLSSLLNQTVDQTKLGSRPVIPVKDTDTALEAFRIMAKYNRSGIAVVDEDGRFVGNTSGSDLKLFIQAPQQNTQTLKVPVLDFLAAIRRADLRTKSPTITVTGKTSIEQVVGKLHATRVHRVFVADDAKGFKPEAVISLTDVLNHLLRHGDANKVKVDAPA